MYNVFMTLSGLGNVAILFCIMFCFHVTFNYVIPVNPDSQEYLHIIENVISATIVIAFGIASISIYTAFRAYRLYRKVSVRRLSY